MYAYTFQFSFNTSKKGIFFQTKQSIWVKSKMSAHFTIFLTLAFAMYMNSRIVVARSVALNPSEILKDMEEERLFNRLGYDNDYQRYMQGYPYGTELEQAPPMPGYNQLSFEKFTHNGEQIHNNLDEQDTLDEERPEPLPNPAMQMGERRVELKKSGPQYHMTICHFKVCNMGRKRDTQHQLY